MKTLAILAIILGVIFIYFVFKMEKSPVTFGDEVSPGGVDISKLFKNIQTNVKTTSDSVSVLGNSSTEGFVNDMVAGTKDFISRTIDKISEAVKNPIENKVNEVLCPQK